jgi:hypothetical protein
MKKAAFFLGPRAGSGRLGHFKIGQVGPYRLGLSLQSMLVRNTKVIKTRLQSANQTSAKNMIPLLFSSRYEVFSYIESCMLHSILLFIIAK